MSSPSVFHAPVLLDDKHKINNNSDSYQRNNHTRKRRPIDPPEEGNTSQGNDYNLTNNDSFKRQRTTNPDDLFGSLRLTPPDPPAHSFCNNKRKKEEDDDECISDSSDGGNGRYAKIPRCQHDGVEQGEGTTISSTTAAGEETSQFVASLKKPDPPSDHAPSVTTAPQQSISEMDNEMSIDDNSSINSNSDISISEGSLQRAMYQAVFGRRNSAQHHLHSIPTTIGGGSGRAIGCCYDAVDSKIEDLIRRSRMEAEIRSRKEEKQITKGEEVGDNEDEMEMDGE